MLIYDAEHNTHEWEILDHVGLRDWMQLACQVIRKFPVATRAAAARGGEVCDELVLLIGEVGGEENAKFLVDLCEKRPSRNMILALGRTKNRATWPALRKVVESGDFKLAAGAVDALARMGDREGLVPTLKQWLTGKDVDRRRMALYSACQLGARELADAIVQIADQVEPASLDMLHRAAVSCGNDRFLDAVHAQARDESEYRRWMNERSPDPAIPIHNWNYRQNEALDAIQKLASPKSLKALDDLAANGIDPSIRRRATDLAAVIRKAAAPAPPATQGEAVPAADGWRPLSDDMKSYLDAPGPERVYTGEVSVVDTEVLRREIVDEEPDGTLLHGNKELQRITTASLYIADPEHRPEGQSISLPLDIARGMKGRCVEVRCKPWPNGEVVAGWIRPAPLATTQPAAKPAPAATQGEKLPGSVVSTKDFLPSIVRTAKGVLVMAEALDEPKQGVRTDGNGRKLPMRQTFSILMALKSRQKEGQSINIDYDIDLEADERAVRKGERMIWMGADDGTGAYGFKALADTPENRKIVTAVLPPALAKLLSTSSTTQPAPAATQVEAQGFPEVAAIFGDGPGGVFLGFRIDFGPLTVDTKRVTRQHLRMTEGKHGHDVPLDLFNISSPAGNRLELRFAAGKGDFGSGNSVTVELLPSLPMRGGGVLSRSVELDCGTDHPALAETFRFSAPDINGPLSKRLRVRVEAPTWKQLVEKARPDLSDDRGQSLMMWIRPQDSQPSFHLERAFTWKPARDEAVRWVLLELTSEPPDAIYWNNICVSAPATSVLLGKTLARGAGPNAGDYAVELAHDDVNGSVYEIGWKFSRPGPSSMPDESPVFLVTGHVVCMARCGRTLASAGPGAGSYGLGVDGGAGSMGRPVSAPGCRIRLGLRASRR